MDKINSNLLKYRWFLLGIIDGVLKGIEKDKVDINDFSYIKVLDKEKESWINFRKELLDKIQ